MPDCASAVLKCIRMSIVAVCGSFTDKPGTWVVRRSPVTWRFPMLKREGHVDVHESCRDRSVLPQNPPSGTMLRGVHFDGPSDTIFIDRKLSHSEPSGFDPPSCCGRIGDMLAK
jgi:hypothetical protein